MEVIQIETHVYKAKFDPRMSLTGSPADQAREILTKRGYNATVGSSKSGEYVALDRPLTQADREFLFDKRYISIEPTA